MKKLTVVVAAFMLVAGSSIVALAQEPVKTAPTEQTDEAKTDTVATEAPAQVEENKQEAPAPETDQPAEEAPAQPAA